MTDIDSNPNIVSINDSNAQQMLIDESHQRLVVADFWADWCAPCKALMPLLEKLADEYAGQFLLAKVNADEQAGITGQFGVQSLPTVMLIKDGQPIDGFTGAQAENSIRDLLEKHLPKSWDVQYQQAQLFIDVNNFDDALPLLREAYQASSQRSDIALLLAQVYIELNRTEEAEDVISKIPMVDQDAVYEKIKAQLELKKEASKSPELEALEARHQENPNDLAVAYQLALQLSQDNHHREAMELLYSILQENLNYEDGAVKKSLVDMIASLGKGDPLSVEYQRKMYTLLY
ncbi:MAG: thioredoxin [Cellvibrionaceae bacterium]